MQTLLFIALRGKKVHISVADLKLKEADQSASEIWMYPSSFWMNRAATGLRSGLSIPSLVVPHPPVQLLQDTVIWVTPSATGVQQFVNTAIWGISSLKQCGILTMLFLMALHRFTTQSKAHSSFHSPDSSLDSLL